MNRKTKAIIQAAVAMGYGTEADYSGASVGATLEEFAAIASEGGGGGQGGVLIVPVNITHEGEGAEEKFVYTLTKTYREIKNAGFAVFQIQDEENSVRMEIPTMFIQGDEIFIISAGEDEYLTDSVDGYPCAKHGR